MRGLSRGSDGPRISSYFSLRVQSLGKRPNEHQGICLVVQFFICQFLRWVEAMRPPPPEPVEEQADAGSTAATEHVTAQPTVMTKEDRALREVNMYVHWVIYDSDNVATLSSMLAALDGLTTPLSGGMLVAHYDHAKVFEASEAFTSNHNPFQRIPKFNKDKLIFVTKVMNSVMGEKFNNQAGDV